MDSVERKELDRAIVEKRWKARQAELAGRVAKRDSLKDQAT